MFGADLYLQTMRNVSAQRSDFYLMLGDDFSIDPLISRNQVSREAVDQVYVDQRTYVGIVGASSPLFLVNGNHEQAARTNLDGTANNPAVLADVGRRAVRVIDAYRSGTVLPNSGNLRVTVSPANVRGAYVRSYLPKDETATRKNASVAFS